MHRYFSAPSHRGASMIAIVRDQLPLARQAGMYL
jgi:hypothetical protein